MGAGGPGEGWALDAVATVAAAAAPVVTTTFALAWNVVVPGLGPALDPETILTGVSLSRGEETMAPGPSTMVPGGGTKGEGAGGGPDGAAVAATASLKDAYLACGGGICDCGCTDEPAHACGGVGIRGVGDASGNRGEGAGGRGVWPARHGAADDTEVERRSEVIVCTKTTGTSASASLCDREGAGAERKRQQGWGYAATPAAALMLEALTGFVAMGNIPVVGLAAAAPATMTIAAVVGDSMPSINCGGDSCDLCPATSRGDCCPGIGDHVRCELESEPSFPTDPDRLAGVLGPTGVPGIGLTRADEPTALLIAACVKIGKESALPKGDCDRKLEPTAEPHAIGG